MSAASGSSAPLVKRAAISSLAVFGSRLLGLLREQVFAYFFGAGREYDAFLTAFRVPNLLRDLLAEGALSTAFVAVFSRELDSGGKARAYAVANGVGRLLTCVLLLVVGLGIWAAPWLVHAIALGFDADKLALTVALTRLMFPFILFVALAALCMGQLNAQGRFGLPQSASSFFNLTSIVVGLTGAWLMAPDYMGQLWQGRGQLGSSAAAAGAAAGVKAAAITAVTVAGPGDVVSVAAPLPLAADVLATPAARAMVGMAIGTLAGGLVQWWIQVPLMWRLGWRPWPAIAWRDPAVGNILRLMGPAILGAAAVQLSVLLNSNFASALGDRAISWLSYSFRLMQFPIGVFGVAIMSATLPTLSRQAANPKDAAFGQTLTQALALVLLLTVPAAVGLALLGEPIVCLMFEHGRFTGEDTRACAQALAAYAVGLPGYSALKVVQPAFVARGDAKTPMVVTLVGIGASVALNAVLVFGLGLGHVGLALSTAVLATGSTCALLVLLERRRPTLARAHLAGQGGRVALAALGMALVLALAHAAWDRALGLRGPSGALMELTLLLPTAVATYFGLGQLLQIEVLAAARARLRRRMGR